MNIRRFWPKTLKAQLVVYGGLAVLVATALVTWLDFRIMETDHRDLLQRILLKYLLSDLLFSVLLIAPLWFFLEHRILRPINKIVAANRALAEGQYAEVTIPASAIPDNEIGEIMCSHQEMLARLEAMQQELRQQLKEMQYLSITDSLTGLYNRRALEERLEEELRRAQRYQRPLADLDNLKHINDTYSHCQGDVLLQQVARLLRAQLRETDFIARYGGDEFVILLPETVKAGGLKIAERIKAEIEAYRFPYAETLPSGRLTISLGVASFPEDLVEVDKLIHTADQALYHAKRAGGGRVCGA